MNDTGPRLAMIETSQGRGWVALGSSAGVLATRPLSEARRHARDLAPLLAELLIERGWKARELHGVIVSRGPGSYTGLRVGVMSAKTLAYASGASLLAIDTFAVIAAQTPAEELSASVSLDVIADAQQEKIYAQRFRQGPAGWAGADLRIVPFAAWQGELPVDGLVSGPALELFAARLPQARLIAPSYWLPRPEALLLLGLARFRSGERDDPFAVEPLYLRPSAAEEKFTK